MLLPGLLIGKDVRYGFTLVEVDDGFLLVTGKSSSSHLFTPFVLYTVFVLMQTIKHSHAPQCSYIYNGTVMPMMTNEASEQAKRERAQAEPTTAEPAEPVTQPEPEVTEVTEPEAEGEGVTEAKPKRSRKREKVAVA